MGATVVDVHYRQRWGRMLRSASVSCRQYTDTPVCALGEAMDGVGGDVE
jgi:hypothetical protein